ncbi:MAG: OmpH family outer membrane protein [Gemmobacter sp.]
MRRGCVRLAPALMALLAAPLAAQEVQPPLPDAPATVTQAPILILRQDQLFDGSAFGRASSARREAASRALIAENRQIEAELEAEELDLTARRAALPQADFRALADAFNDRVETIRSTQDAKARAISRMLDEDRSRFLGAVVPVLADIMAERGAVAILDQQTIVLSFDRIDITAEATARIDARIGTGDIDPAPEDVPAEDMPPDEAPAEDDPLPTQPTP